MSEDNESPAPEAPPAQEAAPELIKEAADAPRKSEPKRRGRPTGSKDTAPRKKKVVIRSEPIVVHEPPKSDVPPQPPPPPQPPTPEAEEDPPTPRTMLRETSKHLVHLRGLVHQGHKTEVASKYTSRLVPWPL
jgi:hypothetical protein